MHISRNPPRDRIKQNVTMDDYNFEHVRVPGDNGKQLYAGKD